MVTLTLISHVLCPYVQRISISLQEKGVPFERRDIDLSAKPDWFLKLSPLGKVPVLIVEQDGQQHSVFESSVILQYLEEMFAPPMLDNDPLIRARQRSWIEVGSSLLNDIAGFYMAPTESHLEEKREKLASGFRRVEEELLTASWFQAADFSLVDCVYAPVFRYFDVFEQIDDFGIFQSLERTREWRLRLSRRASVKDAAPDNYPALLREFLKRKESALAVRMA
ncbi:MAG: glutathione S-transferase family protein [Sneathiellales bacterium]|nr:glutathione S-transferase family protein [Sneathiellales bacterium]